MCIVRYVLILQGGRRYFWWNSTLKWGIGGLKGNKSFITQQAYYVFDLSDEWWKNIVHKQCSRKILIFSSFLHRLFSFLHFFHFSLFSLLFTFYSQFYSFWLTFYKFSFILKTHFLNIFLSNFKATFASFFSMKTRFSGREWLYDRGVNPLYKIGAHCYSTRISRIS